MNYSGSARCCGRKAVGRRSSKKGPWILPSVKMAAGARPRHGARAISPTRLPRVLPLAGTAPSPAAPLRASPASPRFWLPPLVQAPEPGSGCCRPTERTRGRGKCFRGNGPGVGVCKLASVPAGAAAAAGLARSAWAWRRRRAAGETAGGRAWQVSETDRQEK